MKQQINIVIKMLAVSMFFLASTAWAGAKSTVNSQSNGNIKATADANGSNNTVNAKAGIVSIHAKNGQTVSVQSNHNGDVTAKATSSGSHNKVSAKAVVVDVTSGD